MENQSDADARRLRETLDGVREGIQILARDWRYLYVNDAAARQRRTTVQQLLGRTMFECHPGIDHSPLFATLARCMLERCAETIENEFAFDPGRPTWFELRIEPCAEGLIVLSMDITARKQLEEKLRQDEKLRALGQLTSGVAHQLKNILNPIALDLQLVRARLAAGQPVDEALQTMEDAVRTGAEAVETLRRFSRHEPIGLAELADLNQLTDRALEICRPRLAQRRHVQLRREGQQLPLVLVRGADFVTAVVHLVRNAVEALPGAGTITVRSGCDEGAWVEVEDDGPGIPPTVEARICEPFFTTKAEGSGLGLAMVYAFVQQHGGQLTIDTAPGSGTAVRMWFNIAKIEHEDRGLTTRRQPGATRLLVVEDDTWSRQALRLVLEDKGFTVESVASGEDALARLPSFRPHLLLVDYRLRGLDGAGVARAARQSHPGLPIVFVSGEDASSASGLRAVLREPLIELVTKPVDLDKLVDILDRMLADSRAADSSGVELAPN
jgi:PAS domain S-box-containing protein